MGGGGDTNVAVSCLKGRKLRKWLFISRLAKLACVLIQLKAYWTVKHQNFPSDEKHVISDSSAFHTGALATILI